MQMGFFSIVGIPLFQALAGLFQEAQVSPDEHDFVHLHLQCVAVLVHIHLNA